MEGEERRKIEGENDREDNGIRRSVGKRERAMTRRWRYRKKERYRGNYCGHIGECSANMCG
tara:strand:+ start:693 stop:875 length:183 start_codon:yes stop_codon:yes gene_type:complete